MTTDIEKSPNPEDNGERTAISDSSSSACSILYHAHWWDIANKRRCELIELKLDGLLTDAQREEFEQLQELAGLISKWVTP